MFAEFAGVVDLGLEIHDAVARVAPPAFEEVAARCADRAQVVFVITLGGHPVVGQRVEVRREFVPDARIGVVGERGQTRYAQALGDGGQILVDGDRSEHVAPEPVAITLVEQCVGVGLRTRSVPRGGVAERNVVEIGAGGVYGREIDRVDRHRVVEQIGGYARSAVFVHQLRGHLQRYAGGLGGIGRDVALERILLHVVSGEIIRMRGFAQHAELVVGGKVEEVFHLFAAAAQVDVGVLAGGEILEEQIVPIYVGIDVAVGAQTRIFDLVLGVVLRKSAGYSRLIVVGHVVDTVGYGRDARRHGETVLKTYVDRHPFGVAARFGSDDHHAIGTAGAVKGRGGGILEDGERFDCLRWDRVEDGLGDLDTVEDDERRLVCAESRDTADPEVGPVGTRLARRLYRYDTGDLASER